MRFSSTYCYLYYDKTIGERVYAFLDIPLGYYPVGPFPAYSVVTGYGATITIG